MRTDKLVDAIGMVGDDLIAEAKKPRRRSLRLQRIVAAAACLALIIGMLFLLWPGANDAFPTTLRMEAEPPGQGFVGNYSETQISGVAAEPFWYGISVTAKAVEMLPDTYLFLGDSRNTPLRLVRMETIRTLYGETMVDAFYFLLPEKYAVDLTVYDALVIDNIQQYGYENNVLYNQTAGCYESFPLVMFGTFQQFDLYINFVAFSNGSFDESLWLANEAWKDTFSTKIENLDNPKNYDIVRRGWILPQVEEKVRQHRKAYISPPQVHTLSEVESETVIEALTYVAPFENGVFIPNAISGSLGGIYSCYRRYLNGYPTNETILILGKDVSYSDAKFTDAEMEKLPNLTAALHAIEQDFEAGEIAPPHICDYSAYKLYAYSIRGWYAKTDTAVYGIIRIDWRYDVNNLASSYDDLLDDKYYIIEFGTNDVRAIDRDALIELLDNESDYVFDGKYNENGKVYEIRPMI